MTLNFAVGVVIGAAAVALLVSGKRIIRYCVGLWRVVASVEPRRRGEDVPAQTHDANRTPHRTTSHDAPVRDAK